MPAPADPPNPFGLRAAALKSIDAVPADPQLIGAARTLNRLCRSLTQGLDLAGAAVQMVSDGRLAGVIASTGAQAEQVSEVQFEHGEGPAIEACRIHRPVIVVDLGAPSETRWPAYRADVLGAGRTGVAAFPLQVGAASLGVLEIHSEGRMVLDDHRVAVVAAYCQIALDCLLESATNPSGELEPSVLEALDHRIEIARAQGMVMIDLDVNLVDALARLRANAFANDERLLTLAKRVLSGFVLPKDDLPAPPTA